VARVSVFLWFERGAEAAVEFYRSVFEPREPVEVTRYPGQGEGPTAPVLIGSVVVGGVELKCFDGGPLRPFNEAVSLFVTCADQAEVDRLWHALGEGGEFGRCGWLKDRFGVSWQVVPEELGSLLGDPDPARAARARTAMLAMDRLDLAALRAAADAPD
jgi:predicted 3-demethylubiquinone-9 3-methyltransferase (glyoxalase superfamily)